MSYSLEFSAKSLKQLRKLSNETRRRIIATLKRCRVRPYPHVKRLVGSPYYRLRVGEYRVILNIIGGRLVIFVVEIDHRKRIYKR